MAMAALNSHVLLLQLKPRLCKEETNKVQTPNRFPVGWLTVSNEVLF
jgi:hypothetical protein